MPRIKHGGAIVLSDGQLVDALADELRASRPFGQPIIDERRFPETGRVAVTVVWDRWQPVPEDERHAVILDAYRQVEGDEFVSDITHASGMTYPEAYESGFLPFEILPLLREDDVRLKDLCVAAMKKAQASEAFPGGGLKLRFSTLDQAVACRNFLILEAPGTEAVWTIAQEVARPGWSD
jgi:hypothetical protein